MQTNDLKKLIKKIKCKKCVTRGEIKSFNQLIIRLLNRSKSIFYKT